MKASLKLRDGDQKPLLRFKIPLVVAGLPFFSGVSAGDSSDLQLDLGTSLPSGPSLRLSYRPNSPSNPFSLSLKTGAGPLGSPSASPMSVHVEFNLLSRSSPSFSVLFKPRLGDFSLRRLARSQPPASPDRPEPDGFSIVDLVRAESPVEHALSGIELAARTVLPIRTRAAVRFHWGVRIPTGGFAALEKRRIAAPSLVMNKVSVEYLWKEEEGGNAEESKNSGDAVKACESVREQLEMMRLENGVLRKAVEELRVEVAGGKPGEFGRVGAEGEGRRGAAAAVPKGGRRGERKEEVAVPTKDVDLNAELRKALMEAKAGGSGA